LNICDTQLQAAEGTDEDRVLQLADQIFGWLFTVELAVNLFATLVYEFIKGERS